MSRSAGSPLYALLCIAKPLASTLFSRSLVDKACIGYVNNPHYARMKALERLTDEKYRQDVINGGLSDYILEEYKAAHQNLGDISTEHVVYQYMRPPSPFFNIFTHVLGDLPMVYCAFNAVMHPSRFSLASVAILQQSSTSLRYSLHVILQSNESFKRNINVIKGMYSAYEIQNKIQDGTQTYPVEKREYQKGMSFELQNVSFSYPGSTKTSSALENISLSINSGDLVVIVGANGSGKSTLIRILSRLYDPASGQVLIDGSPTSSYRMSDLHQATAILSQDNLMYPVSLSENIGLGCCEYANDDTMIAAAADLGGASEFVSKLSQGINTVLDPYNDTFALNLHGQPNHPLQKELEALKKTVDVSGGEKQRVVVARTFMRFNSGKVKFLAVDEPSSALDAEGELRLFEKLLEFRSGKTMVFVTHKFGHLTRHADKIICMKEGVIAESGTHQELMKLDGQYAKLYNIQASAFVSNE